MDGVKISEIPGLMLSKHLSDSCDCEDGEGCREYRLSPEDEGWDKAIDLQGQVRLSLSRENLAKLLQIESNWWFKIMSETKPLDETIPPINIYLADALIEKQKDLFVVVK